MVVRTPGVVPVQAGTAAAAMVPGTMAAATVRTPYACVEARPRSYSGVDLVDFVDSRVVDLEQLHT